MGVDVAVDVWYLYFKFATFDQTTCYLMCGALEDSLHLETCYEPILPRATGSCALVII